MCTTLHYANVAATLKTTRNKCANMNQHISQFVKGFLALTLCLNRKAGRKCFLWGWLLCLYYDTAVFM